MSVTTLAIIALAFSLDLLVGEPPSALDPIAWFERLAEGLDRDWGGDRTDQADGRPERAVGVAIALVLPLVPAVTAGGAVLVAAGTSPFAGGIAAAFVLFFATSLRRPLELLEDILGEPEEGDLDRTRERIRGIDGRDDPICSPERLRSTAIESAATTLSDGLLATLLPFALLAPLSLPAAAAVVAWVAGVTALSSTLGSPEKPIGTASAGLHAAVTWLPARITAACIAVAALDPGALLRAREWARVPSSPAGWPAATLAAVLEARLEKPGAYVLNSAAPLPSVEAGDRAQTVVGLAAVLGVLIAAVLVAVGAAIVGSEPIVLAAG